MKLRRLLADPSPLSMLGTIVAVGYFVWWGCASTAAPTLRPPTALPDGQRTQVGIGGNASFALLNTGAGATLWAQHRFTDRIEIGGFAEYGAIAWNSLGTGDTVLGGGLSGRFYILTDRSFRLGVEAYVAAAQTFALGSAFNSGGSLFNSGYSPLTLAQTYVSLPMAVAVGRRASLYTNPAAGLIEFVSWYGRQPTLPTAGIPLPTFRVPLGGELRVADTGLSLVAEVGVAGLLLVGMGPYASLGAAYSF